MKKIEKKVNDNVYNFINEEYLKVLLKGKPFK